MSRAPVYYQFPINGNMRSEVKAEGRGQEAEARPVLGLPASDWSDLDRPPASGLRPVQSIMTRRVESRRVESRRVETSLETSRDETWRLPPYI